MNEINKPKTVAIVGGTLWGNRGAEAMLVTTIGRVREQFPDARCLVYSYYPEKDRELCRHKEVEFFNYRPLNIGLKVFPLSLLAWLFLLMGIRLPGRLIGKELDAMRRADVLCDVGGITFCDGREIFLLYNVLSILPAMLLRVPVIKLSQAMGPFRGKRNRFFANRILPRCQHVFSRGQITSKHLRKLNLDPLIWSDAADVAFGFQESFSLTVENEDRIQSLKKAVAANPGMDTVAIVPSSLVMSKNPEYVTQLSDVIRDLVSANCQVLLLPNATRATSDKVRNNDLVTIRALVDSIQQQSPECLDQIHFVDFDINTDGIRRLMAVAHVVVTSRFHGMVAALADAIPVLVIGWSHKYLEVLAQFDFEEYCCDHHDANTDLSALVISMLANRVTLQEKLRKHLPAVARSSGRQLDLVCKFLADDEPGESEERTSGADRTNSKQPDPALTA